MTFRVIARFLDAPGTCRTVPRSASTGRQLDVWPGRSLDGAGFPIRTLLGLGCLAGGTVERGGEASRAPHPSDGDLVETTDPASRLRSGPVFGLAVTRTGPETLDLDIVHRTGRFTDRLLSGTVRTLRLRLRGLDDDAASALADAALSGLAFGLSPRESLTRVREYARSLATPSEPLQGDRRVVALAPRLGHA